MYVSVDVRLMTIDDVIHVCVCVSGANFHLLFRHLEMPRVYLFLYVRELLWLRIFPCMYTCVRVYVCVYGKATTTTRIHLSRIYYVCACI